MAILIFVFRYYGYNNALCYPIIIFAISKK